MNDSEGAIVFDLANCAEPWAYDPRVCLLCGSSVPSLDRPGPTLTHDSECPWRRARIQALSIFPASSASEPKDTP